MAANPIYRASYRHGVDEKRRVQIPAKWRPEETEKDPEFTLLVWEDMPSKQTCLRVLPPREVDAVMAKIQGLPAGDPEAIALRRNLARNSDVAVMDKAGRICIPEWMAKAAAIEKEAELVGAWQWFEIWNPERHVAAEAADRALAPEAVKKI